MGDFDGRLRDFWGSVQQLCLGAGSQSSDPCRCVCAWLSASSGAVVVRHHFAPGKDSAGTGQLEKDAESWLEDVVERRKAIAVASIVPAGMCRASASKKCVPGILHYVKLKKSYQHRI